jgi:hypothetical protein
LSRAATSPVTEKSTNFGHFPQTAFSLPKD